MNNFDSRKKAEEARYAAEKKYDFKVQARRNKLLGLWAADLMDLTGDDAEAYAKTVVLSDLEEPGEEDVFRKIRDDLESKGVDRSDERIREHMAELLPVAREQIARELE